MNEVTKNLQKLQAWLDFYIQNKQYNSANTCREQIFKYKKEHELR
jgi:hypothetical protein